VGLAALAALPAGVVLAQRIEGVRLLDAAFSVPVAAVLGIVALGLGGNARREVQLTLGRVGGDRLAQTGRLLGGLALYLALTAALALGVYGLLSFFAR
jgi:hypothetical protein